jgi:hypothetical protein
MGLVQDLAQAIARYETANFNPATLGMRNNNPGNLRSWGAYPVVNGYVQFPDYATGLAALEQQTQKNIDRGLNLYEFFGGKAGVYGGYAPAADQNQPKTYAETVAGWLGISAAAPLSTVASAAPPASSPGFQWTAILSNGDDAGGVPTAVVAALGVGGLALLWLAFA